MHKTLNTLKILILALILAGGLQYVLAAWAGPTTAPPGGNTSAPINISSTSQTKAGALWADGGFFSTLGGVFTGNGVWANQYCDENGENCVSGDSLSSGSTVTWLATPVQVLDDSTLDPNVYETATISQVPAGGTAILRVLARVATNQDEVHIYMRKKGSAYTSDLFGLNHLTNIVSDVTNTQLFVQVDDNSQIEYKLGDSPIRIKADLLGYISQGNSGVSGVVSGTIIGGGFDRDDSGICTAWGSASCVNTNPSCPQGSTERQSGAGYGQSYYWICVED